MRQPADADQIGQVAFSDAGGEQKHTDAGEQPRDGSDRTRAERLFGFRYRIEVFVPAAKRDYGYYVFPILEGSRLIGRIDMKCDRESGALDVTALWPEPGIRFTRKRGFEDRTLYQVRPL